MRKQPTAHAVLFYSFPRAFSRQRHTQSEDSRLSSLGKRRAQAAASYSQSPIHLPPPLTMTRAHNGACTLYPIFYYSTRGDRIIKANPRETTFRLFGLFSIIFYVYSRLCSPSPCAAPEAISSLILRALGTSIASRLDSTFINSAPRFSPHGFCTHIPA